MQKKSVKKSLTSLAQESLLQSKKPLGDDVVLRAVGPKGATLKEIADRLGYSQKVVQDFISAMQDRGVLVHKHGDKLIVESAPPPMDLGAEFPYVSRSDNSYLFGVVSDTHLGSKYERLDVLNDLYKHFRAFGVDRVFHAGNWIEGECRINRHELHVYGLDPQCQYFADYYPEVEGLRTYAITADCHEGWFARDAKIDVGRHLENVMRASGREDWVNIGFLESNVPLVNVHSKKATPLLIMHPGGGSAYAYSYKPQKIIEGFSGGEKPAALVIGHYHKSSFDVIRNVFTFQAGCTKDQSIFERRKQIHVAVGGWVIRLIQDPETGALVRCQSEFLNYFDRGYYNDRWSSSGDVIKPRRKLGV